MTNYAHGHRAEQAAADWLTRQGYKVLEQNWRTKYCEIDIIASKNDTVYFTEVKYRQTHNQGDGLDYITPKKLTQMTFAAELWLQNHDWPGDSTLSAIEVFGDTYEITDFIDEL